MNVNDPIADLLTRIRNGQKAKQAVVNVPASKVKIAIVYQLQQAGFVKAFKCIRDQKQGMIRVALKYDEGGEGVISSIQRVSKSACRRYVKASEIPLIKRGYGLSILSTSKGIMSGKEARKKGLGGEHLCSVY